MAEVMNMPVDSLDHHRDSQSERPEKSSTATAPATTTATANATAPAPAADDPPPPPPPSHLSSRRRDRDFRDRREDRDFDRPPNRRGGDFYDRNMSPPPRERDRDYKRRRSPSPPYRDRRHSPLPRRSPPPPPPQSFKRSRRDEFDRRGSPRGGFGPDDRRFGYDYVGGYERGMGGRPGYADEKSYGRFMNRSSGGYQNGPSDWESNHNGFADTSNTGSTQREGLMSYKQFIQELEDDILPAEAERRYQEYRSEYISTQKRTYFDAHKAEEWLRDKYHPTNLLAVIDRRNEQARQMAKDFLLDLQSGTLDLGPGINASASNKSGQASDPNSDDEADTSGKRRRHGRGPVRENDISAAPKAHPISSDPRRIQADIEQARALVRKLDFEKGIEDNILSSIDHKKMDNDKSHSSSMGPIIIIRGLTSVKGLEGIELLDTLITYLWRIHGLDYYGMVETAEAKGLRHVRAEGKSYEEISKAGGADWEKKLDSFWQERLRGQDPLERMTAKDKIDAAAVEVLDPHVRKIRDEKYGWKYGCGAKGCTKLFHAAEFVHKHLKLKHPELVMELTSKMREDLYFQNYMNDPDAPGGTPVMQQPQPKDKLQRRRPGMDNRLRDDRGNRREYDRIDRVNESERFDRTEKSPSRDRQTKAGGLEGGNLDESMYDTYGGQGLGAVSSFPSDMPPPVLMPVPGAGPLGPFVPAPPEVAMRMLREQGGPPPYEGSGRNMRSVPQIGGPSPMLAVSQAFRQDPRRLRSYQDLDAPEDEVTVIDYRSL